MDLSHIPTKHIDAMNRRLAAARKSFFVPLEAHACPETGVAVILGHERFDTDKKLVARHFKSTAISRYFDSEKITSNHERAELLNALRTRQKLAEKKEASKRPHDLKVGEIIVRTWGVTMRGADFYKVIDIPSPRRVTIASIGSTHVSGDWMAGEVMPDESIFDPTDDGTVYDVDFSSGQPVLKSRSSIERLTRWSGKPVSIWSD